MMNMAAIFKATWPRCLVVSIVFSIIAPLFTFMVFVPEEGAEVPCHDTTDPDAMAEMTPDERAIHLIKTVKLRKLTGIDRFIYPFTFPGVLYYYLRAAVAMFIPLFLSSIISSFLCIRVKSR